MKTLIYILLLIPFLTIGQGWNTTTPPVDTTSLSIRIDDNGQAINTNQLGIAANQLAISKKIDTIYMDGDSLVFVTGGVTQKLLYNFKNVNIDGASGNIVADFDGLVPDTISADQHNRPVFTGTGCAFTVNGGDQDFTGMVGGVDGVFWLVYNYGPGNIKFKHNNNSSTYPNRVFTPNGQDFQLQKYTGVYMGYSEKLNANILFEARH